MTTINVLAGSRAMRDRLKLFNVCMGSSIGSQRTMDAISTPPPHSIFHHGDSKTRWNNLLGVLAVNLTAGPSDQTNSPHPSSREGHHSTVGWISVFLLSDLILYCSHAAATSLVQRNSVPSTHMRCMITASRRASATIAFFIPRCLAIFIAQALSQDHFAERTSMIWAAS